MRPPFTALAALAVALTAAAGARADSIQVSYEAPGVQNTTATFAYTGEENFNGVATGKNETVNSRFETTAANAYQIAGTYTGLQVAKANQKGGAGGAGHYATTFSSTGYTLSLSASKTSSGAAAPLNYFGFWLSALDIGNQLSFYRGGIHGVLVYTMNSTQINGLLDSCKRGYCGNPNPKFKGRDASQAFVFLNFFDTTGSFDTVLFRENPRRGGYESDNQTVGYYTKESGTDVPEPATLGLLGVGAVLATMLGRRGKEALLFEKRSKNFC